MQAFLCMRLFGPMVAWGDIAVGEKRPASAWPSRSGLLGLVAGALGIRRSDADALAELDGAFGVASRTDDPGELLVDYHTAQSASGVELRRRGAPPSTRKEELAAKQERDAIQSWRTYFMDVRASACLWARADSRWKLEAIRDALRAPAFTPYLGRKSCVLAAPCDPRIVEAENPVEALRKVTFDVDSLLVPTERRSASPSLYRWEDAWSGLNPQQTVRRRDRVHSRARWQFVEREEHILQEVSGNVPQ